MNSASIQTIRTDGDIVVARRTGRKIAEDLGFSRADQALIATAISELARNIVVYATSGEMEISPVNTVSRSGVRVKAQDYGPGIQDIKSALTDGFSTGGSLGLGLPGTRRIVDEFDIQSVPGEGVTVTIVKWRMR